MEKNKINTNIENYWGKSTTKIEKKKYYVLETLTKSDMFSEKEGVALKSRSEIIVVESGL